MENMKSLFGKNNGSGKKSLQAQLTKIIILSCLFAVAVQGIVMITMLFTSYVRQEREDTEYIIESANSKAAGYVQFLEDTIISIRNSRGLKDFFYGSSYDKEVAVSQLVDDANLFAEKNRVNAQYPFLEKVYVYNNAADCIEDIYFPGTVVQKQEMQKFYASMKKDFEAQDRQFYFVVDEDSVSVCMHLYDEEMAVMGVCIAVMNRGGMESLFDTLEKYKQYSWSIEQGDELLVGANTFQNGYGEAKAITNQIECGFSMTMKVAVSKSQMYESLTKTILVLVTLSIFMVLGSVVLSSALAYRFVRPLHTVADKIKQVGKGDFQTKLETYDTEELNNISETFNDMTDKINQLITQVYENQLLAKQAQIQYLQAQINPHFMFNVLSMIRFKAVANQDEEVQKMIYMLSKLLQGKIFRKDEILIHLQEEMELVDFYLYLQSGRFGNKISYEINYGADDLEELMDFRVPRLSIEPIVENAVCHGLEPKEGDGHICVNISVSDALYIEVTDNGVGFNMENVEKQADKEDHSHMGIINTRKMIHNLCGEAYGITVSSKEKVGTTVIIRLPIERNNL
ncbi:MAG: sensor histidine kinase [Lachnospiraceae bacterium]|nr:sensor histidine kinase [Lachnospiraceae bacterium]